SVLFDDGLSLGRKYEPDKGFSRARVRRLGGNGQGIYNRLAPKLHRVPAGPMFTRNPDRCASILVGQLGVAQVYFVRQVNVAQTGSAGEGCVGPGVVELARLNQ